MYNIVKNGRMPLAALLAAVLLAALAVPAAASSVQSAQNPGYYYPQWGQPATVRAGSPVYADSGMTVAVDAFKGTARVYTLNYLYDRIKVYSPDEKRAAWVAMSNISMSGQPINLGVVISSSVSIRRDANTRATLLKNAQNGEVVNILSEYNGWYQLQYTDPKTGQTVNGYARTDFIMAQPRFIIITVLTDVYAMPQSGSKKVGQVAKGATLMVLGQMTDYYAIGLRSASGFVRTRDVVVD